MVTEEVDMHADSVVAIGGQHSNIHSSCFKPEEYHARRRCIYALGRCVQHPLERELANRSASPLARIQGHYPDQRVPRCHRGDGPLMTRVVYTLIIAYETENSPL